MNDKIEKLDIMGEEFIKKELKRRALLCLEASISYLMDSISIEEVIEILRKQAQYLEDHQ